MRGLALSSARAVARRPAAPRSLTNERLPERVPVTWVRQPFATPDLGDVPERQPSRSGQAAQWHPLNQREDLALERGWVNLRPVLLFPCGGLELSLAHCLGTALAGGSSVGRVAAVGALAGESDWAGGGEAGLLVGAELG